MERSSADEPAARRQRVGEHVQQVEMSGSASAADINFFISKFLQTHVAYSSNRGALVPVISKKLQGKNVDSRKTDGFRLFADTEGHLSQQGAPFSHPFSSRLFFSLFCAGIQSSCM
jgi:hypothetical protein